MEVTGPTLISQFSQFRASWVAKTKKLGTLIESFTSGIVQCFP